MSWLERMNATEFQFTGVTWDYADWESYARTHLRTVDGLDPDNGTWKTDENTDFPIYFIYVGKTDAWDRSRHAEVAEGLKAFVQDCVRRERLRDDRRTMEWLNETDEALRGAHDEVAELRAQVLALQSDIEAAGETPNAVDTAERLAKLAVTAGNVGVSVGQAGAALAQLAGIW